MRTPLAIALLLALAPPAAADPTPEELQQQTPALIEQLGSEKYAERRAAQRDLAAIGLAAFDPLYAARDHDDLEIASTAERLLAEMTIRWAQPGDSPAVREQLELYGRLDADERAETVAELGAMDDAQGLAALCRIARFDLSDRVAAKAAALAMHLTSVDPLTGAALEYRVPEESSKRLGRVLKELQQYYGPSSRPTSQWLYRFASQSEDPAAAAREWRQVTDRLAEQIENHQTDVDTAVLEALRWNLLRVALHAGDQDAAARTVRRVADDNQQAAAVVLRRAFDWFTLAKADQAVEELLTGEPQLDALKTQQGLYLAAGVRRKQGREQEAQRLADQAFEQGPEAEIVNGRRRPLLLQGRVIIAARLRDETHSDWAIRELRAAIEESGHVTPEGAYSAWLLADTLHDAAEHEQAAAVLQAFIAEVQESPQNSSKYQQLAESRGDFFRPLAELMASEAYYRALALRDAGDASAHREALLEAFEHDSSNADIPIAMYRSSQPGEEFREMTLLHIQKLADEFEQQIDQDPTNSTPYNQWAWLIANTEGDYDKAVRYSLRSLALSKNNAGYLDTLGRCYYAAGNLEKAIEAQSRAVELQPEYQVMQRQLKFFQEELAKQQEQE